MISNIDYDVDNAFWIPKTRKPKDKSSVELYEPLEKQLSSLEIRCSRCEPECNCAFNFSCECEHDCCCADMKLAEGCFDGDILVDIEKLVL